MTTTTEPINTTQSKTIENQSSNNKSLSNIETPLKAIPETPLIICHKLDVPKKYRYWTSDYDISTSVQSYNQLKSSAKYIFSKIKPSNTSSNTSSTLLSEKNSKEGISSPSSSSLHTQESNNNTSNHNKIKTYPCECTILGNFGEVYRIDNNHTRIRLYDWFPKNNLKDMSNKNNNEINLENKSLYLIDSNLKLNNNSLTYPLNQFNNYRNPNFLIINDSNSNIKINNLNLNFNFDSNSEYIPYIIDSSKYIVLFNKTKSQLIIFDYKSLNRIDTFDIQVINSNPVFDIKDSILMYISKSNIQIDKKKLIQVNLSSKKNLINKLIKTFSNTVLDSMFMFSEITQQKIKHILQNNSLKNDDFDFDKNDCIINDENLKENYIDIFTELYNTISKNSDFINAIDLSTKKNIFQMSVPSGCSKISISPYDLQFLTASIRGDEIFLWDYTNANNSIILMDKYIRGKTSAIIDQLEWGTGNQSIFCLSRQNGSLHHFINESLRNYEDFSIRKIEKKSKSKLNSSNNLIKNNKSINKSWCLSNLKLKSFKIVRTLFIKDFIIAVDSNGDLLTIDIENGCIDGYLKINFENDSKINNILSEPKCELQIYSELLNPEIEVETCKPFLPAYNNLKYKFKEIIISQEMKNLDLSDILSDLDSHINVVKTYNIAGTLYENQILQKHDQKYQQQINSSKEIPTESLSNIDIPESTVSSNELPNISSSVFC
ncbi:hypothetical protein C6P42_000536 [Pichia californica]|nr:hypothetical protein C6P42_000536 [[Candida] californica]